MNDPIEQLLSEFVEKGADLEHDRWGRWQAYMFSKGTVDENGVFHLPKEFVDRWFRQIDTPYAELSEPEKESDRKETRNYLPLVQALLQEHVGRCREEIIDVNRNNSIPENLKEGYFLAKNDILSLPSLTLLGDKETKDE